MKACVYFLCVCMWGFVFHQHTHIRKLTHTHIWGVGGVFMGGTDAPAGEQSLSLGSQEEEERRFLPPHQRHHQQLLSRSGHPVPRDLSTGKKKLCKSNLEKKKADLRGSWREVRPKRRHGAEVRARSPAEAGLWDVMFDGRGEML